MIRALALCCLALVALPAAAQEKVVLRLNFTPWGMHAQYYAALKQGFYKAEGLDMEIRPAAQGQQNEVLVASGREQFGVANADGFIKARSSGVPVTAIAADQPDSPWSIISLKTANITRPEQLKGKKISMFNNNPPGLLDGILKAGGLSRSDITIVTVGRGAENQMLAAGQIDALLGYYYGQALTLEQRGFPNNVMLLRDYGLTLYGTVLYTNDALLKGKPEIAEKFLRATIKGLIWARTNMDEAMSYVIAVAPDREGPLEVRKLGMIYDVYKSPDFKAGWGRMNDARWEASIAVLKESGELGGPVTPKDLYTNAVLDKIPEAKQLADQLFATN